MENIYYINGIPYKVKPKTADLYQAFSPTIEISAISLLDTMSGYKALGRRYKLPEPLNKLAPAVRRKVVRAYQITTTEFEITDFLIKLGDFFEDIFRQIPIEDTGDRFAAEWRAAMWASNKDRAIAAGLIFYYGLTPDFSMTLRNRGEGHIVEDSVFYQINWLQEGEWYYEVSEKVKEEKEREKRKEKRKEEKEKEKVRKEKEERRKRGGVIVKKNEKGVITERIIQNEEENEDERKGEEEEEGGDNGKKMEVKIKRKGEREREREKKKEKEKEKEENEIDNKVKDLWKNKIESEIKDDISSFRKKKGEKEEKTWDVQRVTSGVGKDDKIIYLNPNLGTVPVVLGHKENWEKKRGIVGIRIDVFKEQRFTERFLGITDWMREYWLNGMNDFEYEQGIKAEFLIMRGMMKFYSIGYNVSLSKEYREYIYGRIATYAYALERNDAEGGMTWPEVPDFEEPKRSDLCGGRFDILWQEMDINKGEEAMEKTLEEKVENLMEKLIRRRNDLADFFGEKVGIGYREIMDKVNGTTLKQLKEAGLVIQPFGFGSEFFIPPWDEDKTHGWRKRKRNIEANKVRKVYEETGELIGDDKGRDGVMIVTLGALPLAQEWEDFKEETEEWKRRIEEKERKERERQEEMAKMPLWKRFDRSEQKMREKIEKKYNEKMVGLKEGDVVKIRAMKKICGTELWYKRFVKEGFLERCGVDTIKVVRRPVEKPLWQRIAEGRGGKKKK